MNFVAGAVCQRDKQTGCTNNKAGRKFVVVVAAASVVVKIYIFTYKHYKATQRPIGCCNKSQITIEGVKVFKNSLAVIVASVVVAVVVFAVAEIDRHEDRQTCR